LEDSKEHTEREFDELKKKTDTILEHQIQQGQSIAGLTAKIDAYIETGTREHDALFERTKGIVKWGHLAAGVGVLGTVVGLTMIFG
jgi:hypothetical protein